MPRFMIMGIVTKDFEAGPPPKPEAFVAMQKYNEEAVKAGILLAAEGLTATSKGARVKFSGDKRTVIDGPFAESKELVAGFIDHQGELDGRSDRVGEARSERLSERRGGGRDPQVDGYRGLR